MQSSLFHFFLANKRYLIELALASLLVNAVAMALPLFSMLVYDKAVGNDLHDTLWALAIGMALLLGLELITRFARVLMIEHAGARWDVLLDERLMRGVLAAPASASMPVGRVLSRYRELSTHRDVLSAQGLLPLADLPFALLYTAALFIVGGVLVTIPLVTALLLIGVSAWLQRAGMHRGHLATQFGADKLTWLTDVLQARESLQSGPAVRRAESGFRAPSLQAARASSRARLWQQFSQQLLPVGMTATSVLILVAGVYRVEAQAMSVGGLIASTMLGGRLLGSLSGITPVLLRWKEFKRALKDLGEAVALDAPALQTPGAGHSGETAPVGPMGAAASEGIRLDNVSLRYPNREPALSDITLSLRTNELVVVVGASGAGKTTLLRLLAGHLSPSTGRLAVGGQVIADDVARRMLAAAVAYKPQDAGFLRGTVAQTLRPTSDNTPLSPSQADDADVQTLLQALRASGLGPLLERGELGLNTELGAGGQGLSGGQRHMLAVARTLAQPSDVLLLDEPTLGLDRQAQDTLLTHLGQWKQGRCMVVSSHCTELIQMADRIIVLDRGRVVADAPPTQLLAPSAAPSAARPATPRTVLKTPESAPA